jgi:hypothetical protein
MPKASAPAKKLGAYLSQVLMKDKKFGPVRFSSFLYESRLPKLGGWCQAIVSCSMGTSYPYWLVKKMHQGASLIASQCIPLH